MNSADYRPQFDDSVVEFLRGDPQGRPPTPINHVYCLTRPSALCLAKLFSPAPVLVMAPPTQQNAGSPFAFNHLVPWLKFATGGDGPDTLRNAGELASYWGMPGVPYDQALSYAQTDVGTPVEGQ